MSDGTVMLAKGSHDQTKQCQVYSCIKKQTAINTPSINSDR